MITKHNRRQWIVTAIVAAAAVAVPAMLFAGTGTAEASASLHTASDSLGVTGEVHSTGSEGLCFYIAEPCFGWQTVKPLPVYKVPFYLQANQTYNLWFPGIQT